MENLTNCPLCHNHCPIEDPNCGRGKTLAEQLKSGESIDPDAMMRKPEHGEGHGHGGHHAPKDRSSLEGLLRECGHVLHHGGNRGEELFSSLTEEEQETLKALLQKLTQSWT